MQKYISFNKTKIVFNKKTILKKFILKTIPLNEAKKINQFVRKYHATLYKNSLNIPKLISHNNKLEFKFEYCGHSLVTILKKKKLTKKNMSSILKQITDFLKMCETKKIGIDPHFKNFTILNQKIYFVDVYPPVTKNFTKLLIKYNPSIKKQINDHLSNYAYNKVKHHFLADLKKTKNINKKFYEYSKKYFVKNKILKKINYKLINKIIKIEDTNLNNRTFTLT